LGALLKSFLMPVGGTHVTTGAARTENADLDRLLKEASGQLSRARALLASAHRLAVKMPLEATDQEKSKASLAEAIGLCVTVTHSAKANNLYKLLDSGLNPSELRHSVERALSKPTGSHSSNNRRSKAAASAKDAVSAGLLVQLDACRRINLEGLRWLTQASDNSEESWRGKQLLKLAEQLCVVTALESKLHGRYPLGSPTDEPASIRKAISDWASDATRKELAEE
jgi:hypothetical protein